MKKRFLYAALLMAGLMPVQQLNAQRLQQKLGRGVVAVQRSNNVLISWRKLAQEGDSVKYNIYTRTAGSGDYTKLTDEPVAKTNYQTSTSALPYNTEIAVTTVIDGKESEKSAPWLFKQHSNANVFLDINFETKILDPNDYKCKYVWPADMDGDGEIDTYIVDRRYCGQGTSVDTDEDVDADSSSSEETTGSTQATRHMLQAYKADGTCLWTVDMGPNVNIDAGQDDMVTVYDIDCDGKCEVLIKSSDGTRFWDAEKNTWGLYAMHSDKADVDGDGIVDYAALSNTTRNPPFYISVIDGLTGAEKYYAELNYDQVTDGEDKWTRDNRSDYMNREYYQMAGHFAVTYDDGVHPSLFMECLDRQKEDGTAPAPGHHNYVFAFGFDWVNGKPTNFHHYYTWSRNDKRPWPAEFHMLRVADVDGDGIDEMLQGGFGVNSKKDMVFSADIKHGDRFFVTDIDPTRPGMETFAIQQSTLIGQYLYDSATGKHLKEWYLPSIYDVGRGAAFDIDPDHLGLELWSYASDYPWTAQGKMLKDATRGDISDGIWWDGDLGREQLSQNGGSGYNSNLFVTKTTVDGSKHLNDFFRHQYKRNDGTVGTVRGGSGTRPAFWGDIFGDWREEVILMKQDANSSTGIVGYSTEIPTDHTMYALQEDPHYRLDCTTRGYYQSPNTSFYLGYDMFEAPLPPIMQTDLRYKDGSALGQGATGFTSFDQTQAASYQDGKSIIFDISGDNSKTISINGEVKPSAMYVMAPKNHDYTFGGTGKLMGDMTLYKSMQGKAIFNNDFDFKGNTVVSEGELDVNGKIAGKVLLKANGTLGGNAVLNGGISFEGSHNYAGCRLAPGTGVSGTDASGEDLYGTITINQDVVMPGKVYVELDADMENSKQDRLVVNGNLTLKGKNTFTINGLGEKSTGKLTLVECTGELDADPSQVDVLGLDGKDWNVTLEGKKLMLTINKTRDAAQNVIWTGSEGDGWNYKEKNFKLNGTSTTFVTDDEILFDNSATQRDVAIDQKMQTKGMLFDFNTGSYTLSGEGNICGDGYLTKKGKGDLNIGLEENSFTGPVDLQEGKVTVKSIANGGVASSLGAASADEGNLKLGNVKLTVLDDNCATDRILTLTGDSTEIDVKSSMSITSNIVGPNSVFVKSGPGQLNLVYQGEYGYKETVVKEGVLSQGNYLTYFGSKNSKMTLAGGTVKLIENNNMKTIPSYPYPTEVKENTENMIVGTFRSNILGTFTGKGSVTLYGGGDRCAVHSDFSKFEGTLKLQGANSMWRETVVDMPLTDVVIDGKLTLYRINNRYAAQANKGGTLGSLASTYADAQLGAGIWTIGANNHDAVFNGQLVSGSTVTKVGTGTWTLNSGKNTSNIAVNAGRVILFSGTSGSVSVAKDAVLAFGDGATRCSAPKVGTDLVVNGGKVAFNVDVYRNDQFTSVKNVVLDNAIISVNTINGKTLAEGDEITLFKKFDSITGTFTIQSDGYVFDASDFLTTGKLRVTGVSTGISGIRMEGGSVEAQYDLQGRAYDKDSQLRGVTIVKQQNGNHTLVRKIIKK